MSNWKTLEGKTFDWENLDKQHLRNIYWYHKLLIDTPHIRKIAMEALQKRYRDAGTRLVPTSFLIPYIPRYDWEVAELEKKGFIRDGKIYDPGGSIIGSLLSIEDALEKITNNLRDEIISAS